MSTVARRPLNSGCCVSPCTLTWFRVRVRVKVRVRVSGVLRQPVHIHLVRRK